MKLTDQKAINIYKRLKMIELIESIDDYPENERDGRSDLQFLVDEISYFRSNFEEDGHVLKEDLDHARRLLRKTKNGTVISVDPVTFKPKRGYWPSDIETAKSTIAEYKQLQYYEKRLNAMGYFGKW